MEEVGEPRQTGLAGIRGKAQTQAEYVVECKDTACKAKDRYDEEVDKLLAAMEAEDVESISFGGVTFMRVQAQKIKIEGYKRPAAGE